MPSKIRPDAFDFYVGLGHERSYVKVAARYGVSKRAVVKVATREKWQDRLHSIEAGARHDADKKAQESLAEMGERHIRCLKLMQRKALEALREMPLESAMEAVRTLDLTIKQERLIRGEPDGRTAISVEERIRSEYDQWLVTRGDEDDGNDDVIDVPVEDAEGDTRQESVLQ